MVRINASDLTRYPRRGFTAFELLAVVAIIMVLAGLLIPVVGMVRESSRRAQARALIADIHMALRVYADEDGQRRFPPADSDHFLRYDMGDAPLVLNRLMGVGLKEGIQKLAPDLASGRVRVLVDPWQRPYRYQVDQDMDAVIDRPAPKDDWNARGLEPFAYVWSLGQPKLGHFGDWSNDPDALARNSQRWIYVANTADTSATAQGTP